MMDKLLAALALLVALVTAGGYLVLFVVIALLVVSTQAAGPTK